MTLGKNESLTTILESEDQIHLTMYLENRGDLADLKTQVADCMAEAEESLKQVLQPEELEEYLQPVASLLEDASLISKLRGNIGLFRTHTSFRMLSIPVDVKQSTYVASSFHVKPLLRWMQSDCEFLLLELEEDSLHLYLGSQQRLRKIDTILYPKRLAALFAKRRTLTLSERRELKQEANKTFSWVIRWIEEEAPRPGLKLFIAGEKMVWDGFIKAYKHKQTSISPVMNLFLEGKVHEVVFQIRSALLEHTRKSLEQALFTFAIADQMNRTEGNLREIAKAVVSGKVKKLVIAHNREIFGKLDPKTGKLAIHPFDLDHEDDDLLDDLAQKVLMAGGEVYLAKKEEIPSGRLILAILENDERISQLKNKPEAAPPDSRKTGKLEEAAHFG